MRHSLIAGRIMLVIALLAGVYFLRDFLGIAALAALSVVIFNPLYRSLVRWLRGRTKVAATLTVIAALVIVILPLIAAAVLSYFQTLTFLSDLKSSSLSDPATIGRIGNHAIQVVNDITSRLPQGQSLQLSAAGIGQSIRSFAPTAATAALNFLRATGGDVIIFISVSILYLVLFFTFLIRQDQIIAWLKRVSPLDDAINSRYLRHITAVSRSMVLGTFVVALVQGVLGATFLAISGIPYPIFWAMFLSIVSIVPLGSGIITIPIAILEILFGHIWQGLFVITMHLLVITNIDNLLRALLVSKDGHLSPVLTLFAIFAGLEFFGPLGAIYGPVIMAVIMTTLQIYDEFSATGIPLKGHAATSRSTHPMRQ